MPTRKHKTFIIPGLIIACSLAPGTFVQAADVLGLLGDSTLQVDDASTYVHEHPDSDSPILRTLFPGELVSPVQTIETENGQVWLKIRLGANRHGYVRREKFVTAGRFPRAKWHRSTVVRDERPFSLTLQGLGETYGGSINVRYLPFTRIGVTAGVGPVFDGADAKGTALSFGLMMFAGTRNLSPFLIWGAHRLSYHDGLTVLKITSMHFTIGLEWAFDWGGIIGAGMTYIRSMDVSVTVKYDDVERADIAMGDYGRLGDQLEGELFQALQPCAFIGYGF